MDDNHMNTSCFLWNCTFH